VSGFLSVAVLGSLIVAGLIVLAVLNDDDDHFDHWRRF
jgi:hypothetical protein